MIRFSQLSQICEGKLIIQTEDVEIHYLLTDSRKIIQSAESLFFAIVGTRNDGHRFIDQLYHKGISQFVIEKEIAIEKYPNANFFVSPSSLGVIQKMAEYHRSQFAFPVIAVTGSNGKTVIKEWLYQLLSPDFSIVKNPGSYNSQLGVPLSVWQMRSYHNLGIFEAGISLPGEMKNIEKVLRPSMGIFSNIGTAHDEGFNSIFEKIKEKLRLFINCDMVIYRSDQPLVREAIVAAGYPSTSWGYLGEPDILLKKWDEQNYDIYYQGKSLTLRIPFKDVASIENVFHCVAMMLHLGYGAEKIQAGVDLIRSIPMRLELKQGINNCQLIDDTYNNDLVGLQISLEFLGGLPKKNKTIILSDILQSGLTDPDMVERIKRILVKSEVSRLIAIGPVLHHYQEEFATTSLKKEFHISTDDFLKSVDPEKLKDELVLIKGARVFHFERIVNIFQLKIHGTVMEIDLGKIIHNLNFFKSRLRPDVKLMVMVKAFAYGSGSEEVADLLQFHRVDYLGVAYADEGVNLRRNHISIPIMVMNANENSFDTILQHHLEPAIYSFKLLESLTLMLRGRPCNIHLEIETGMNRLGLNESQLTHAIRLLQLNRNISVVSIFSHLAGADEATHDEFSNLQMKLFSAAHQKISDEMNIKPMRHLLNSSGIIRFPLFQFEMVRLGIGLYGINPTSESLKDLKTVAELKTVISQVRKIEEGQTIGYGRQGKAEKAMVLATIAIGYADGFSRSFSQGKGKVAVHGQLAPVVGNVCMDMTMIDITGIPASEGDEVIIFGEDRPIYEVAKSIQTIPYEILTNTSERVKRIFFAESI